MDLEVLAMEWYLPPGSERSIGLALCRQESGALGAWLGLGRACPTEADLCAVLLRGTPFPAAAALLACLPVHGAALARVLPAAVVGPLQRYAADLEQLLAFLLRFPRDV